MRGYVRVERIWMHKAVRANMYVCTNVRMHTYHICVQTYLICDGQYNITLGRVRSLPGRLQVLDHVLRRHGVPDGSRAVMRQHICGAFSML